ncbi:MAG: hydrolase, partial [Candidatus Bathyarchaeia archaeon]
MPFTPLHIGPSLTVGYSLRRRMHLPTLIVASLAVDAEPLIVIILRIQDYPLHGYLHTFLLSIPLGFILGVILYTADRIARKPFRYFSLSEPGDYGIGGYVSAGVLG